MSQIVDEIADRLGERHVVTADQPDTARFQLFDAVVRFLAAASERSPLVVALDDIQWADGPSLELLAFLTPHLSSMGIVVLATYRDVAVDRRPELVTALAAVARQDSVEELRLDRLSRDEVATVLADALPEPPEGHVSDLAWQRSDGNPFFVRQLARLVQDAASPEEVLDLLRDVPPGIRHVLHQRLQVLPPSVRATLEGAAVLGRTFEVHHLAGVCDGEVGGILDAMTVALAHGLVERASRQATSYRFVHCLVRETIYDELDPGRTARLHAAAGAVLEATAEATVDELAEHFWLAAAVVDDERPVRYAVTAADAAAGVLGYAQAEQHLQRALQLVRRRPVPARALELEVRLRLLQLANNAQRWTDGGRFHDELRRIRDLTAADGIPPQVAPLWWSLWNIATIRGEAELAWELAELLSRSAQQHGDPASAAAGHIAASFSLVMTGGDRRAAAERLHLAEPLLEELSSEDRGAYPELLGVTALAIEATIASLDGDRKATLALGDRAVEAAGASGQLFAQAYAGWQAARAAATVGAPAAARRHAEASLVLCEEHGFDTLSTLVVTVHAWALAQLSTDAGDQVQRAHDAIRALEAMGHRHLLPQLLALLAEMALLVGDREGAERRVHEARVAAAATGERFYDRRIDELEAACGAQRPANPQNR